MNQQAPVLTIDGPSGSGKGTASRAIAKRLGWHYLDSGAIYRSLAIVLERDGVALDDDKAIIDAASALQLSFRCEEPFAVLLNGEDVSAIIQSEKIGSIASQIAVRAEVRAVLLQKQRDFQQRPGLVADGRDMGTVVFPEAQFKLFLTASAQVRAERRYKQLREKGINVKIVEISRELEARDKRDRQRTNAPLVQANDAHRIESSALTIEEVVVHGVRLVEQGVAP